MTIRAPVRAAADYIRDGHASKELRTLLAASGEVITFEAEHANRPPRFVAIVAAYRAGTMVNDIRAKFGCTKSTVLRYARLAGEPLRPKATFERSAILADYAAGLAVKEIAVRHRCSAALVSSLASTAGVNRRIFA